MAGTANSLSVEAKLNDHGVISGAKGIKTELQGAAGAAAGLNEKTGMLAVALGNLAAGAISEVISKSGQLVNSVIEIGSGFETSMSKVEALSGSDAESMELLEAKARELGASTTYSAAQAADALGYMALAGWDTQQMLEGVGPALTLAQAGEMDLAAASDLVTDYLSAFNMQADETQRMVDVLAYAQANANTTVEGLGMAFKNCAANANAFGMDVETTSSAIAMMANQGLKGSEAGTALNAVMRDMTAQMEDGAIKIGDASVAVMDAEGNYRDFIDVLADIEGATNGMGDAEKAAALQSTFTADSIKGLNLLLNAGAGEAASFRDDLYGCAGAAQETADTMTDNLGGDLAAMNSAFEETAIKIYQSLQEPLRECVQFVTSSVIPGIEFLIANLDKIAPVLVGIGAGFIVMRNGSKAIEAAKAAHAALKATVDTERIAYTKYFATGDAGNKKVYKWNATTKEYELTQKSLRASLATSTAGMKVQQTAIKASEAAMKLGSVAARALTTALKAIAPIAAMTALVEVVTLIGGEMERSSAKAANLEKATSGMTDAMQAGEQAFNDYAPAAQTASDANEAVKLSADEVIEAQAELVDKTRETWAEAGTNSAVVAGYADTIARLAEKGELTAEEQAELKLAVEAFNEETGNSIAILDTQTGKLNQSKDAILDMAEAYKQEAMAEAARELYKDHAKQLIQDNIALKDATAKLEEAQANLNGTTDPYLIDAYAREVADAQSEVNRLTEATNSEKDAMSSILATMQEGAGSFETLDQALESCGLSMESFAGASEGQLAALQEGFHGSLNDIVGVCAQQGMEIPAALANAIMANSGLPKDQQQAMLDAMVLQMTGGDVKAAAAVLGHDIDQGLVDGITGSADMPAAAMGILSDEVIEKAKEQFDSHSPSLVMQQLGTDIDQGLSDGIGGNASGPVGALGALAASMLDQMNGLPGASSAAGASAGFGLASGLGTATGAVAGAAGGITSSVLSGIQNLEGNFAAAGQDAVTGYTDTIEGADAYNAAHSLGVTAERGLAVVDSMKIGRDFGQGYILGMGDTSSSVYQAAYELGKTAIRAVKDAQDSASPSKVSRSLGGDYGQGYGLGIEGEYAFVAKKSEGLVEAAVSRTAMPTIGIDWYSTTGRYNSASMLDLPASYREPQIVVEGGTTDNGDILLKILEEIRALHKDLPKIIEAYCLRTLVINEREFARLVHDSEDWY